jgi:hypothetical protein
MKNKIVLISFIVILITNLSVKAQIIYPPDTSTYDTLIIYQPPQIQGCPMVFGTNLHHNFFTVINYYTGDSVFYPVDYSGYYASLDTYADPNNAPFTNYRNDSCGENIPISTNNFVAGYNHVGATEIAQPYHLDSTVLICGIATQMEGDDINYKNPYYFHLLDTNFNVLRKTEEFTCRVGDGSVFDYNDPQHLHCFYFSRDTAIRDFYLSAELCYNGTATYRFNHTLSLYDTCLGRVLSHTHYSYDTVFVGLLPNYDSVTMGGLHSEYPFDTIVCCQSEESPWLKDTSGVWTRFADNVRYSLFQKTYLEFLPIILVPKSSSISEVQLENMCYVFPNPTRDFLEVKCNYNIRSIDVYNMQGQNVLSKQVNNFMTRLDVRALPKGSYIIKLLTSKGSANKKFIKE